MNSKMKGHLFAFLAVLLWGSVIVSTQVLLGSLTNMDVLFWRFALGYLFLWILAPKKLTLKKRKHEIFFLLCGLTGVSFYYLLQNIALRLTSAADVSIIGGCAPIATCLLYQIINRKRGQAYFYLGFVIAISGIILVCKSGNSSAGSLKGDLIMIAAIIAWGFYSIISEMLTQMGYDSILCVRRFFFWGLLSMLPFMGQMSAPAVLLDPHILLHLLYIGVGGSGMTFLLWNIAIQKLGAVSSSVYIYLMPVVTIAVAFLVQKDPLTIGIICGSALTILGSLISGGTFHGKHAGGTEEPGIAA